MAVVSYFLGNRIMKSTGNKMRILIGAGLQSTVGAAAWFSSSFTQMFLDNVEVVIAYVVISAGTSFLFVHWYMKGEDGEVEPGLGLQDIARWLIILFGLFCVGLSSASPHYASLVVLGVVVALIAEKWGWVVEGYVVFRTWNILNY